MTIREAIAERIRLADQEHAAERARMEPQFASASDEGRAEMKLTLRVLRERANGMRLLAVAIDELLPKE